MCWVGRSSCFVTELKQIFVMITFLPFCAFKRYFLGCSWTFRTHFAWMHQNAPPNFSVILYTSAVNFWLAGHLQYFSKLYLLNCYSLVVSSHSLHSYFWDHKYNVPYYEDLYGENIWVFTVCSYFIAFPRVVLRDFIRFLCVIVSILGFLWCIIYVKGTADVIIQVPNIQICILCLIAWNRGTFFRSYLIYQNFQQWFDEFFLN